MINCNDIHALVANYALVVNYAIFFCFKMSRGSMSLPLRFRSTNLIKIRICLTTVAIPVQLKSGLNLQCIEFRVLQFWYESQLLVD